MTPDQLKSWRIENGYSQRSLADSLGVIVITVSRWETGARDIPPFLHLALKSLPKKGGVIRRGRPALSDKTTKKKRKERKQHGDDLSQR
jgi:transcriptional regulator with XRE-family HTH domain